MSVGIEVIILLVIIVVVLLMAAVRIVVTPFLARELLYSNNRNSKFKYKIKRIKQYSGEVEYQLFRLRYGLKYPLTHSNNLQQVVNGMNNYKKKDKETRLTQWMSNDDLMKEIL